MPTCLRNVFAAWAIVGMAAGTGRAAMPTAWEMSSWQDFIKGRFEGLSLSREGRITLAPSLTSVFQAGQPMIWSVASRTGGDIYLGTGHQGKVYRVTASGSGELVWTAPEPEVFALAMDNAGRLYAGTSPNGKIYRIENGKAAEYFAPGASYIWSLVFGPDGALYVGTGVEGKVYRVTEAGKAEVWYETGQSHVTSLAFDDARQLLAGTEPNGILYRIASKDKAFVLHDAGLPEIRSIVPGSGGLIYAAAMGGSVAKQTSAAKPAPAAAGAAVVSATVTSVTVTDATVQGGVEIKPQQPAQPAVQPALATAAAPTVEYAGVEKSALYRIASDNSVETIWSSKEENAYDLLSTRQGLVFTTDAHGRVYRLGPDRLVTLLAETRESEALRLLAAGDALLIGTGNEGKLYRLGPGLGTAGAFESPVQDAGKVARWGRFSWRSETCDGCKLSLRVRAGNSPRPDKTWSDWSPPLADSRGSAVSAPNARYVQWRAEFSGSSGRSPQLLSARLAYLPQNAAPEVKSITISSQSTPAPAKPAQAAAATYSITVTDTGEAGASSLSGTPTQPVNRAAAEQLLLTWVAEDADGDRLTSVLEYRGAEEREWKLIKDDLSQNTYTIEADVFADGYYYFRVTASDRAGNPPADAREGTLVSPPVLVDRTPPAFKPGKPERTSTAVIVPFDVSDAASPLTRCESSVDGGTWSAQAPSDGILDSQSESFQLRIEPPPSAGREHVLVLRCADSASNMGLARILLP